MSALLSADDLNDFISPGLACIKPAVPVNNQGSSLGQINENGEVEIQIDELGNPLEISQIDGKLHQLAPAEISLSDCLACSGCITSAEEVLVAQHSHEQLIKALSRQDKVFVASISHQSRASLATAFGYSVDHIDRLLINLFVNQMEFKYVVGTSLGRKLSLINEAVETINKKQLGECGDAKGPILSLICPGWVLYAEKTHPHVLPRMSKVKSPQQITGCLLKHLAARELNTETSNIYHLSIMPCFDKKLESARPEKEEELNSTPDVDCVLTAKELVALLNEYEDKFTLNVPLEQLSQETSIETIYQQVAPQSWPFHNLAWASDIGSASGGYGLNYLKMYQNHLTINQGYEHDQFSIQTVVGKNSDIYEMRLMYNQEKVATACIMNGFRNIQNLVRKLKPGQATGKVNALAARRRARMGKSETSTTDTVDATKCDYIEVMACPNGCINGGGQIQAPTDVDDKQWLQDMTKTYESILVYDLPAHMNTVDELIQWTANFCNEIGICPERLLNTWFKSVEPETDPNAIMVGAKW
jgi:iron only hydrogenase large subunit-like protein